MADPHQRPLQLPPTRALEHKAIREAAEEYTSLLREHQEQAAKRYALEQNRHLAAEADRRDYAAAIRAGEDDPGQPAAETADAEILAAGRRQEALELAVAQAHTDLLAAVERHGPELRRTVDKRLDAQRSAFTEAVATLADRHAAFAETLAMAAWLRDFPSRPWRPGRHLAALPSPGRNGNPLPVAQVLEELRCMGEPPAPSAVRADVQPLRPAV